MYVSETISFTSNVTGERYKINYKLTCDDNYLIYLMSCKCCGKQCVGETTDSFGYRWYNYKDNGRKIMIESILTRRAVCKNICLNILTAWDTIISLTMFQ